MVKCKNCKKGRPHLFTKDGGFCNEECRLAWLDKQKVKVKK